MSAIDYLRRRTCLLSRAGVWLLICGLAWGCVSPAAGAVGLATSAASRAAGSEADAREAASSLDAFGFDLYGRLANGDENLDKNLVFSPASIYIALSMAGAGARGETATQMEKVLHQAPGSAGGNGVNSLDRALTALSHSWTQPDGTKEEIQLHIANAPFAQKGMRFEQTYLDTLASRYGAGVRLVDFAGDPEGTRQLINAWVSDQTEKRIPKLIDSLDPSTRLALVNAIYLKAPWQNPFGVDDTTSDPFTRLDGSTVEVPMMHQTLEARYAEGAGWQAVELPYADSPLAMTIILPTDIASFEAQLDADRFASIVAALGDADVDLSLPRFDTMTKIKNVQDFLAELGMPLAMDEGRADFSGITTEQKLFIGQVIHQANITVDEKGTEAAAATVVVMLGTAVPVEPRIVTLKVDRPFVFALRDTQTGAILFLGRIVDPSAKA
jgi:serpin B